MSHTSSLSYAYVLHLTQITVHHSTVGVLGPLYFINHVSDTLAPMTQLR